jgi:FAD/FMN-containing dehydrogenase
MNAELLNQFINIVGPKNALTAAADMSAYMEERRGLWRGSSPVVLRPSCTEEVSEIMKLAFATSTAVVPQSGNTGLVGGQIPSGDQILLSLDRMTKIIDVDAADYTMTVEAGCILKNIQEAADGVDRLFPLSLASEGSCRIGGNLSSNAGGLNVLAYGNARDLCLGLEVVLPDGRIWNGLRKLRKDNTGYDLKELFLGAEGSLGIITKAVLKLFPKPRRFDTAFLAVPHPKAALELLSLVKSESGNHVIAFELVPQIGLDFTMKHMGTKHPLQTSSPWYVLTELADAAPDQIHSILEKAIDIGLVTDGSIAQSETQRQSLWQIREGISESQRHEGGSIKHDVSVPVSKVPQFLEEATVAVKAFMPEARLVPFGHLGDGNIHFNVSQPIGMDKQVYLSQWTAMNKVVFDVVLRLNGSVSAEHGIGQLKVHDMVEIKSAIELDIMRSVKKAFDPKGIMNPGKVLL